MKVEECEGGVGGRSERVVWEGGVRGWCGREE